MPLFDQAAYLPRALRGLRSQTLSAWELVIVDDGSRDGPEDVLRPWLEDSRVTLHRLERNRGLGAALNVALGHARAAVVAYLPADDVFFAAHLETLLAALSDETVVLAHASVAYQVGVHHRRAAQVEGEGLQLVQVAHRVTEDRWTERSELVTDDLERMLWARLRDRGARVATGRVTCEWVDHPWQRHKVIREPRGGLNLYRAHYGVGEPLRFHSSTGYLLEEEPLYRRFRERPATPPALDGLKIVLAGELAYNPERVLALEERGHRLFGLWLEEPEWYNAVGPLPFGHVEDLPARGWQAAIRALRPDVIYGLLNWQAVPLAQRILEADLGVPFVFHLKESPHWAVSTGHWPALREVYARADGRIYSSVEMRDWLDPLLPELGQPVLVLDGDLPKREWFDAAPTRRLSELDGDLHTVVPGRAIGLLPEHVAELAGHGVHVHLYGAARGRGFAELVREGQRLAPRHLHAHALVDQRSWVREFSRYDAGWLHYVRSDNEGDPQRVTFDAMNIPARVPLLAAAGLPFLQRDNEGSIMATQALARERDLGLQFSSMEELAAGLRDAARLEDLRRSVWRQRDVFTFDAHADRLVEFFRQAARGR